MTQPRLTRTRGFFASRSTITTARVPQKLAGLLRPKRLLLPFAALATSFTPAFVVGPYARAAWSAPTTWTNISPPQVSVNASAFHNQNYGFQAIAVDAKSGAVYVGTCYQGIWKSVNQGKTWFKVNTGTNGSSLDSGRVWALTIDPVNPQVLYATAGYGAGGIFKSTDGGVDWVNTIPPESPVEKDLQSEDIASIAIDPLNHNHLLASFHGYFGNNMYASKSPILESLDGGGTWKIVSAGSLSYPQYVFFLNSSSSWLLGTTAKGVWRTLNSGHRWVQVSAQSVVDGGSEIYRAKNGDWYLSASGSLLRSTDNGRTWKVTGPAGSSPYMGVIGDGRRLYTQPASTGDTTTRQHFYVAPEKSGMRWKQFGSQTFSDGPMHMVYDPIRRIVYSSNWRAGVWKLQVRRPARMSGSKPKVLLTLNGHGSRMTKSFTTTSHWVLMWSYRSETPGTRQPFRVVIRRIGGKSTTLTGVKWDGVQGHGIKSYRASGRFLLKIVTEGTWQIEIKA